jgi:DNA-binding response OmpR family regulator
MIPTALVVDDDPVIRAFLRLKLEAKGWNVREANNAAVGRAIFQQKRPHLVVLDLIMSNDDGLDAVHLARHIKDKHPEVALLVITGLESTKEIKNFMHKHGIELFGKSSEDPYCQHQFSRIDVLVAEVRAQH